MGQQLQAMGMHVAVLDVEAAALDAGVASLRASAPPDNRVEGYLCDVSSLSAVEAAAAGIAADFDSPIGFVGANAGTQRLRYIVCPPALSCVCAGRGRGG